MLLFFLKWCKKFIPIGYEEWLGFMSMRLHLQPFAQLQALLYRSVDFFVDFFFRAVI